MRFMKKLILLFITFALILSSALTGCTSIQSLNQPKLKTVEDMAGRKIEVPEKIEKIYATDLAGTLLVYTFDEEKLCGININLTEDEKRYTSKYFQSLPVIGATAGKGKTAGPEEILSISPDIVVCMDSLDESSISNMNKLQEQIKIPVVMLSSDITRTSETYRCLGEILGDKKRADELEKYADQVFANIDALIKKVSSDKKVKVYYAGGPAGLETGLKGSIKAQVIEISGGENVAEGPMGEGKGRTEVSIEQVLKWNPELIIVAPSKSSGVKSCFNYIKSDEKWGNIKAVKDGKVYETPYMPFNWFDKPTSINRLLGIKWLACVMYPQYVDYDIKVEAKKFYKKFYHIDLNNEDIEEIMKNSI